MKIKIVFMTAMAALLTACNSTPSGAATVGKLTLSDAWMRAATVMDHGTMKMDGPSSAIYMLIENSGDTDVLLSASVSQNVAAVAELHQTKEENGLMTMNPMPAGIEVPANGKLEIKPGGYHIMLVNVKQTLAPGQTIKLSLKFKNNGEVSLDVPVRENR